MNQEQQQQQQLSQLFPMMYQGSVKDVRGPVLVGQSGGVIFEYTDFFSVFDWGRMPDQLAHKGEALAVVAAHWFEKLESPETWKEFSRSPEAIQLRKGNRFGAMFNELGEVLQREGVRTHYLGALSPASGSPPRPVWTSDLAQPCRHVVVKQVSVVKPSFTSVLGRTIPDYLATRNAGYPKLVPLEVVFRFSCPPGSSLLERVARDPGYLASIGFGDFKADPGVRWDFPVLELFTKLETTDRPLTLVEALAISGLSAAQLQNVLLKTAWVAGWLKSVCSRAGIELADGKFEWGVDAEGNTFLVDAIGPDELRLLKDGVQLSKEFLRTFYRETPWYAALNQAKEKAKTQGTAEWKRLVGENPPSLPLPVRELGSQLYQALANQLTGRTWFPEAWSLDKVVQGIRGLKAV